MNAENGKGGTPPTAPAFSKKQSTSDDSKVAASTIEGNELWPRNVELLRTRGVNFTHQPAEHQIRVSCPQCSGVLFLHEEKPWHWCNGIACGAHVFTFAEIVAALPVDQVEVSK